MVLAKVRQHIRRYKSRAGRVRGYNRDVRIGRRAWSGDPRDAPAWAGVTAYVDPRDPNRTLVISDFAALGPGYTLEDVMAHEDLHMVVDELEGVDASFGVDRYHHPRVARGEPVTGGI